MASRRGSPYSFFQCAGKTSELLGGLLRHRRPIDGIPIGLGGGVGGVLPEVAEVGEDVGPLGAVLGDVSGVGHVGAFHGRQSEVLDEVDLGDLRAVNQLNGALVAREGVEFFRPSSLGLGRAEPLGERR